MKNKPAGKIVYDKRIVKEQIAILGLETFIEHEKRCIEDMIRFIHNLNESTQSSK